MKATTTTTTATTGEKVGMYFVNTLMTILGTGVFSIIVYTFVLILTN